MGDSSELSGATLTVLHAEGHMTAIASRCAERATRRRLPDRKRPVMKTAYPPLLAAALAASVAVTCAPGESSTDARWRGSIDTLESGVVVVHNPATPVWDSSTAWQLIEEIRIGTVEGDGPDLLGEVRALAVDAAGRIYVLEAQASEIRVFDRSGTHVRTIGRKGGGPGELADPIALGWGFDANLWVIDPQNARIATFDTAGRYVTSHRTQGGFIMVPWPGGFDVQRRLWMPLPDATATERFRIVLVGHDSTMTPFDTVAPPRRDTEGFTLSSGNSLLMASVPFAPALSWRFDPRGHLWVAATEVYRIAQQSLAGDTVRIIEREYDPLPVTDADREQARANLDWFVRQGGKVDLSRIPSVKPALAGFFADPEGYLWVRPTPEREGERTLFDIFDPAGRFLGSVRMPFRLVNRVRPVIVGDRFHAVVTDELEVPFVVRARIVGRSSME